METWNKRRPIFMETLDDSNLRFVVSDRIPITQSRKDIDKLKPTTLFLRIRMHFWSYKLSVGHNTQFSVKFRSVTAIILLNETCDKLWICDCAIKRRRHNNDDIGSPAGLITWLERTNLKHCQRFRNLKARCTLVKRNEAHLAVGHNCCPYPCSFSRRHASWDSEDKQ